MPSVRSRGTGRARTVGDVSSPRGSTLAAIALYTLLRVALFALVWLTIELLTPISGLWALVVAILVSGAISLFVLDRPRNRVGLAAAGFFGRINERIEASARAEDDDKPSGEGEQGPEGETVGEKGDPGLLEGGDERRADRAP